MGVNFWGVVHGCRAFLPHLAGGGHIVNTASIAGLYPGFGPSYDASKHAVVAITREPLQHRHGGRAAGRRQRAVPGMGAHEDPRGRPQLAAPSSGAKPRRRPGERRDRATTSSGRSPRAARRRRSPTPWSTPSPPGASGSSRTRTSSTSAIERWATIAERADPVPAEHVPGMPPRSQILAEVAAALGLPTPPTADSLDPTRRSAGSWSADRSLGTCRTNRGAIFSRRYGQHEVRRAHGAISSGLNG